MMDVGCFSQFIITKSNVCFPYLMFSFSLQLVTVTTKVGSDEMRFVTKQYNRNRSMLCCEFSDTTQMGNKHRNNTVPPPY